MSAAEQETRDGEWQCGITLKRTVNGGATWSIAVPANGEDSSSALDYALEQALAVWDRLTDQFPVEDSTRRTTVRRRG